MSNFIRLTEPPYDELVVLQFHSIKSVPWEYSCDKEYLLESNKGKLFKILLITSYTPKKQT